MARKTIVRHRKTHKLGTVIKKHRLALSKSMIVWWDVVWDEKSDQIIKTDTNLLELKVGDRWHKIIINYY